MRIVAGRFRGRRLAALGKGDPAAHLRPTSDRVRESLFNVLNSMDVLEGARVLDLFAGTGALGLEALSRGAAWVIFVENGRKAQGLIGENIALTGADATRLIRRDATRLGPNPDAACDLVFLDPPYGKSLGEKAMAAVLAGGWITPDAWIVWEDSSEKPPFEDFVVQDTRRYGDTHVTIFQRGADG